MKTYNYALTLPEVSLLLPKCCLGGGGGGGVHWTNSRTSANSGTLPSNNFKFGKVLGISFYVSKMVELMKSSLNGDHDNHSTT